MKRLFAKAYDPNFNTFLVLKTKIDVNQAEYQESQAVTSLTFSYAVDFPHKFKEELKLFLTCLIDSKKEKWFREFIFRVIVPEKEELQEKDLVFESF